MNIIIIHKDLGFLFLSLVAFVPPQEEPHD